MKLVPIASISDYRVGVALSLFGVATPAGKKWSVGYLGQYGFPEDPKPHTEHFKAVGEAMERWKELVQDYHARASVINRLKAFKKDWIPPWTGTRHSANDEAVIFQRDAVAAVMTSQGPKTRRKRIWSITVTWYTDVAPDVKKGTYVRLLIPVETIKPGSALETHSEAVPITKMPDRINDLWNTTVALYRATL